MKERFKIYKIVGREYIVSSKGRVINPNTGYELNGEITPKGYKRLYFNNRTLGLTANKFIHVMVAELFLDKPDDNISLEVNHKDHNKLNNVVDNLEWVSKSYNIHYDFVKGKRTHVGDNNPNSKYKQSNNPENRDNQQPRLI